MAKVAQGKAGIALISVYDKTGIIEVGKALVEHGWTVVSSGGTAAAFEEAGVPVTKVEDITGWPSMLDGRVKTLHPMIHGGILADSHNPEHLAKLKEAGIPLFDLVCVDMYPLEAEIADSKASFQSVTEKIDVGGPTMLNGAAKGGRIVLSAADQRKVFLERLEAGTIDDEEYRKSLAARAFYETSRYYLPIMSYLDNINYMGFVAKLHSPTKYGENAAQTPAGLYADNRQMVDPLGLDQFQHIKGMERSFINTTDMDCLLQTITHITAGFERNFSEVPNIAVGGKHGNTCGAAIAKTMVEAVQKMLEGDTRAIFGGVVMINGTIDKEVAEALMHHAMDGDAKRLLDGVLGAAVTDEALEILNRSKLRVVINPALAKLSAKSLDTAPRMRHVRGGVLRQPNYTFVQDLSAEYMEFYGELSEQQRRDLILAWAVGSTSNSNTITLVKNGMLIGNGAGQQDRVGAAQLALNRTTTVTPKLQTKGDVLSMLSSLDVNKVEGAVAYSDSFFPFPDGPQILADAGIKAILASSGSVGDEIVIATLKKAGVSLALVPDRVGRGFAKH